MESLSELRTVPLQERAIFNLMFFLEHYLPGNERVRATKEGSRLRAAEYVRRGGAAKVVTVDRVRNISPVDFRERYLAKGLPVIIENGAADWPLAKRWSFDNFTERFGESTIRLTQRIGLSDDDWIDEHEYTEEVVFGEFLEQVRAGGRKYMRFAPLLEQFPELLDDFDQDFFREMTGHAWGLTYQLFIGGQGSYTPLHNAITPFFFANVCGIKRWALIPCRYLPIINPAPGLGYNHSDARVGGPNDDRYAGFDSIDRMEAVLQPGDVLFNPPWMWHSVENDSPTIGVRCGFIYPRGMLAASLTLTLTRVFAARNPSLLEALRYAVFEPRPETEGRPHFLTEAPRDDDHSPLHETGGAAGFRENAAITQRAGLARRTPDARGQHELKPARLTARVGGQGHRLNLPSRRDR